MSVRMTVCLSVCLVTQTDRLSAKYQKHSTKNFKIFSREILSRIQKCKHFCFILKSDLCISARKTWSGWENTIIICDKTLLTKHRFTSIVCVIMYVSVNVF